MTGKIDATDIRILEELQKDSNTPLSELAERVNSSKSVCWRRIQRLTSEGYIAESVAILNPKKLGLNVMVLIFLRIDRGGVASREDCVAAIRRFPEVVECHALMGDVDMMLKVLVEDIDAYERFLWLKLSKVEGVSDIRSCISLTQYVSTTRMPLRTVEALRDALHAARAD